MSIVFEKNDTALPVDPNDPRNNPIWQDLFHEYGLIQADLFLKELNHACVALDGFEDYLSEREDLDFFYAPMASTSIKLH